MKLKLIFYAVKKWTAGTAEAISRNSIKQAGRAGLHLTSSLSPCPHRGYVALTLLAGENNMASLRMCVREEQVMARAKAGERRVDVLYIKDRISISDHSVEGSTSVYSVQEKGLMFDSKMQTPGHLVALLSLFCWAGADVVSRFEDVPECLEYFHEGMVPKWGASTQNVAHLCQRFGNRYHFATLFDTHHRIAVYSAYLFQDSNGGGREKRWFVEPQLVNPCWQAEMKDGYWLGKDHPGVYQGERQALNEDYTHSGYDRGHLNPNGHHAVPGRNATFTLTNVVPQNPKLNQNEWRIHESQLTELFRARCSRAYVLVGAVPSADNWIVKNNVNRVNIPDYLWNAYCCVDNNGKAIQSGGASARNTEGNWVERHTLDELDEFLQQFTNKPVGELFHNNCR